MIEEWKSQSLNKEIECHATQRKKRLHNYSHHEAELSREVWVDLGLRGNCSKVYLQAGGALH